mgnify:CR=1 FL=1
MEKILLNNPKLSIKKNLLACFDYDWTLVIPKDGRPFPRDENDWQWYYPNIPKILTKLHNDGYVICIFSNQTKKWKIDQMRNSLSTLNIPLYAITSLNKEEHKPNRLMFDQFIQSNKFSKKDSFFVGDALGRKNDFSDSDKVFAETIGIKYLPPEKMFYDPEKNTKETTKLKKQLKKFLDDKLTAIVMVGYPGAGKSTVTNAICSLDEDYVKIQGDIYKSSKRMINVAIKECGERCVIFDATNSSKVKRKEYIDFASDHKYYVKCIHINTTLEEAMRRNLTRPDNKKVPRIAYSMFKKRFETPSLNEGFDDILVV